MKCWSWPCEHPVPIRAKMSLKSMAMEDHSLFKRCVKPLRKLEPVWPSLENFTKRAFLHGRLDLTQAEAVLDTIHANSLHSLKLAQEHLQGGLSGVILGHRDALVKLLAHVEAGMDFGEEDIQFIEQTELQEKLRTIVGAH